MLAPDPVTRRAVDAAARAGFEASGELLQWDEMHEDEKAEYRHEYIAAIAAYHDAKGEHLAAARVRRCGDQPEPNDDDAFLSDILARSRRKERATHSEIARLKRLADWADAPPCPGWDGTLDPGETERAVDDARRRMG